MRILKDTLFYLNEYGFLNLMRKIPVRLERSIRFTLRDIMYKYLPGKTQAGNTLLAPIQIFTYPGLYPRINLVLEQGNNINPGLDRAIIFSVMAAVKWEYPLRIISNPVINTNHFHDLLISNDIYFRHNAEIMSCEPDVANKEIDVCKDDIFITTSWLTTYRVIGSINENKIIYIMQEDERAQCQDASLKNMCLGVLKNEKIYFLFSSKKLYDSLLAEGFENIRSRGAWFPVNELTDTADGSKNISNGFKEIIQNLHGVFEGREI